MSFGASLYCWGKTVLPGQAGQGLNAACQVRTWGREGTRCRGSARAALDVAVTEILVLSSPGGARDGQTCSAYIAGWTLVGYWMDVGLCPQDVLDQLGLLPLQGPWG